MAFVLIASPRRRRERRPRSFLRHERMTVRMELAAALHHSSFRGAGPEMYDAPRRQRTANSRVGLAEYYELSSDDGRPTGGERPAALLEPWPHGMMERHDGIAYELVQALDAPVLQTVESVVAKPVIAVPKILPHDVPPRRFCRDTQLAEQLVEVPTILYFLKQRIPEQIDDNPVPHGGRGASGGLQGFLPGHSSLKRTANKIADLPAPRSGVRRLQGCLPEQSSTATSSSSLERISERIVEQIAFSRVGEGLQDFRPGQSSSSSSHDPARVSEALDEPGYGFFRTFPQFKKSATLPPHSGSELPPHSSPRTPAPHDVPMVLEAEEEEDESEEEHDDDVEFVEYDGRWWWCEWVPARQRYCWWLAASDGSQAGHTIWRPPWLIGRGPG